MNSITQITGVWTTGCCFLKTGVEIKLCFRCSKSITECPSKRRGSFQPAVCVPLRQWKTAWVKPAHFLLTPVTTGRVNKWQQLLQRLPKFCILSLAELRSNDKFHQIFFLAKSSLWQGRPHSLLMRCRGLGFRNRFIYLKKSRLKG